MLEHHQSQTVRLLTGGGGSRPHGKASVTVGSKDSRDHLLAKGIEGMEIAEEPRLVGSERSDDLVTKAVFPARRTLDQFGDRPESLLSCQWSQPGLDQVLLVLAEGDGALPRTSWRTKVESAIETVIGAARRSPGG